MKGSMTIQSFDTGTYIVAVSGGVDSVVLLDMLAQQQGLQLVVAHFDHGIRPESAEDAEFVKNLAQQYDVPYVTKRIELGPKASEDIARRERYAFLREVMKKHQAIAIVTAHHQDDVFETAALNMMRGTKRRGYVSLQDREDVRRPLLAFSKDQIMDYAAEHKLSWREDSTNTDQRYKRNAVRARMRQNFSEQKRRELSQELNNIQAIDQEIDDVLAMVFGQQKPGTIAKELLANTELAEAYEIAAYWLRQNKIEFDSDTIQRLVVGARTLQNSSQIDLKSNHYAVVKRDFIVIEKR
jgi:tRNA(Ile)-lysidine synthetase-like protein